MKKNQNIMNMKKMLKTATNPQQTNTIEPKQKPIHVSRWTWLNPFTWHMLKKSKAFFWLALIIGAEVITHINIR